MHYGGHKHKLRCNCIHDSIQRMKHYAKQSDCLVIEFQQKCQKCGYNFWHVESINPDIRKQLDILSKTLYEIEQTMIFII